MAGEEGGSGFEGGGGALGRRGGRNGASEAVGVTVDLARGGGSGLVGFDEHIAEASGEKEPGKRVNSSFSD